MSSLLTWTMKGLPCFTAECMRPAEEALFETWTATLAVLNMLTVPSPLLPDLPRYSNMFRL